MKHYNNLGYVIDQEINDRGVPVDLELIQAGIDQAPAVKDFIKDKAIELTGLPNPVAPQQLKTWLAEHGLELANTKKETLEKACEMDIPEKLIQAMKYRMAFAKTSVAKFKAFQNAQINGRVHGMFQYLGASRTGRWAGRIAQLQNLPAPRPWLPKPDKAIASILDGTLLDDFGTAGMDALSVSIRGCIKAPPGKKLVVADLTSIESVVIGYCAKSATIHNIFAAGEDTYKHYGTHLFNCEYDEITKEQRTNSKPAVLGGGFGLGAVGMKRYAEGMGVIMNDEEAKHAVDTFRSWLPEVVEFWWEIQSAVFSAIRGGTASVEIQGGQRLILGTYGDWLQIILPSGRRIHYHFAEIRDRETPWGAIKPAFTYKGNNRFKSGGQKWERISAHHGGITENIVQAMARDVLMVWLHRVNQKFPGYVIGHVHDEIICEVDEGREQEVLDFMENNCADIPWMPGAQLGADGYIATRYRKD